MGAGKTTVARLLSKKLGFSQIEIDDEIVQKSEENSVLEIFQDHGESGFRELEFAVCRDLEFAANVVISTGGGVGIDSEKIRVLSQNTGVVFFLKTEFDTVKKRIGEDENRPLFVDKERAKELFETRKKKYSNLSDFKIVTDQKSPEEVANEIVFRLEKMKLCLVIGDPIGHSISPKFHNAAFKSEGFLDFVFKTQRVASENLSEFFKNIPSNIRGISVTIPHKVEVLKFCDEVSSAAKEVGAANTLLFKNNKIYAENTDVDGAMVPILQRVPDLKNKKFTVLGAGGVARAIICGAQKLGANISVFSRNKESAKTLVTEFQTEFGELSETERISESDIIVNATPCGMTGKLESTSAVLASVFHANQIVFDSVYTPIKTKFLTEAEKSGAKIIPGLEMFVYQAAKQFEIYTGRELSFAFCEEFIQKLSKNES